MSVWFRDNGKWWREKRNGDRWPTADKHPRYAEGTAGRKVKYVSSEDMDIELWESSVNEETFHYEDIDTGEVFNIPLSLQGELAPPQKMTVPEYRKFIKNCPQCQNNEYHTCIDENGDKCYVDIDGWRYKTSEERIFRHGRLDANDKERNIYYTEEYVIS